MTRGTGWRYEAVYRGAVRVDVGSWLFQVTGPADADGVTADVDRESSPRAVGQGESAMVYFASPRQRV